MRSGQYYGWRWGFAVFGAMGILLGFGLAILLVEPRRRIAVQMIGLLLSAPFVVWCGQTLSVPSLIMALTFWGLFKGIYDANIFASALDVVRPEARGTTVGFMNMIGWLVGAGTAPVFIGYIAQRSSLSFAISIAAVALVAASLLLLAAVLFTAGKDVHRLQASLEASAAKETARQPGTA